MMNDVLLLGLNALTTRPYTRDLFRKHFGNEVFEALISKGYAQMLGDEYTYTVEGIKYLLDVEVVQWRE